MCTKRKKALTQILYELNVLYEKDSSEFSYSNEDKIAAAQRYASRDRSLECDSNNEDLGQQIKEAAKYYLKNEEAGAAFMKRTFELYYSNEEEIGVPRYLASQDARSPQSDGCEVANFKQGLNDLADIYFDNEKDGAAVLLAKFLDDEESQEGIESDANASLENMDCLKKAEDVVMSEIKPTVEVLDVPIREGVKIHTVCFRSGPQGNHAHKVPLVMVHGLGGGNPSFHKVYSDLSKDRCVYGIDLPGFALSSRVNFSNDAASCENEMVELIESWRNEMDLEAIILLGHSFGGYISAAYALKHCNRVKHLFLLDPWGVLSKKEDDNQQSKKRFEDVLKMFFGTLNLNPFRAIQLIGDSMGCYCIKKLIDDDDKEDYGNKCIEYFVLAALRGKPTGAKAFSVLSGHTFAYPEAPLKRRLIQLLQCESVDLPITFIYGKKSVFHNKGGQYIMEACEGKSVNIEGIDGGTHHLQVQKPEDIVEIIRNYAFTDAIPRTGEALKTVCDCLTSCGVAKGHTNSKQDNQWKKSDYWWTFARHTFLLLVVVLIAIVLARLYM